MCIRDRVDTCRVQTLVDQTGAIYIGSRCSGTANFVDCSGLIYQCLYAAGINPASNIVDHALAIYEYTSANLAADNRLGIEVASYDLQPGDLVFYAKNGKSSVCHIAIYAGNGCIYDSWPGIGVSYRSLNISGYHLSLIHIYNHPHPVNADRPPGSAPVSS